MQNPISQLPLARKCFSLAKLTLTLVAANPLSAAENSVVPSGTSPTSPLTQENTANTREHKAAEIFRVNTRDRLTSALTERYASELRRIYLSKDPIEIRCQQLEDLLVKLTSERILPFSIRSRIIEYFARTSTERFAAVGVGTNLTEDALSIVKISYKSKPSPEELKLLEKHALEAVNAEGNRDIVQFYALAHFFRSNNALPEKLERALRNVPIPAGAPSPVIQDPLGSFVHEFSGRRELFHLFKALGTRVLNPDSRNAELRRSLLISQLPSTPLEDRNAVAWICRKDSTSAQPGTGAFNLPHLERHSHVAKAAYFASADQTARSKILGDLKSPFTLEQLTRKLDEWGPQELEKAARTLQPTSTLPLLRLRCMVEQLKLLASTESYAAGAPFDEAVSAASSQYKKGIRDSAFRAFVQLAPVPFYESAKDYLQNSRIIPPVITNEVRVARMIASAALSEFGMSGSTNYIAFFKMPRERVPTPGSVLSFTVVPPKYDPDTSDGVILEASPPRAEDLPAVLFQIIRDFDGRKVPSLLDTLSVSSGGAEAP